MPRVPLKPARLRSGDLIGVVSPASPVADQSKIEAGVKYLERHGFRVVVGDHARDALGYLAGKDEDRLHDLHEMFRRNEVSAIVCIRGGYGTPRLLSRVDYGLIHRNPKIVVGFSDITSLQLALWKKTGLVTFHGPMLASDMADGFDPSAEKSFWEMLLDGHRGTPLPLDGEQKTVGLYRGKARGVLLGGNLSLIVNLLATPFCPSFNDSLLLMEEVGEEPYRVDRMFVQLKEAGIFQKAKGVLAGRFSDCVSQNAKPSLTIDELLAELAGEVKRPFLTNVPFGHIPQKLTIPVGVRAAVDADRGTLTLLESPFA